MPPSDDFAAHLVARTTFGMTPQLRAEVTAAGWEAWLDEQLDPARIDDGEMDALLAGYGTLDNTNAQNDAVYMGAEDGLRVLHGELHHATLLRSLHSRRQLFEVMVEFWNNHFTVFLEDHRAVYMKTADDRDVARAHALGRFTDLLRASAHSPAMLVFLDNHLSDANDEDGVNENYARELLELHTLGIIDAVQPFTEADMRGVALVLSGWSIDSWAGGNFLFRPERHHTGPVSLFGGAWSTPGRSGPAGHDDGVSLLDHLARHPSTARHVAWKLCRRFVADDPPPDLVESAATVYQEHDTAIVPVLRHILHSADFAAAGNAKVRRGYEVFTAQARALGADIDPDPLGKASHVLHGPGWGWLAKLGQRVFGHHDPDGYPDTAPEWTSADGMLRRWGSGGALTGNWQDGVTVRYAPLLHPVPGTLGEWVAAVADRVWCTGGGLPDHGLRDVPSWIEDPVRWLVHDGHAGGWPDGTFRPDTSITRGQAANMLHSIAGRPAGHPDHGLRDVPRWIDPAVRWLVADGHANGWPDGTFRPDTSITRGQAANMLHSIAGRPAGHPDHGLRDVPRWIDPAVRWLVADGHANGWPDGTFRPETSITRGQAANMLHSIAGRPHGQVVDPLTDEERAAALALFADVPRVAHQSVPDWLVDWKGHDLLTLLVATPRFLRR